MALTTLTKPRARWTTFKLKIAEAIERVLFDKVMELGVSPEDFGAVADGINDDTLAIEAAFASGEPVNLQGNTYRYVASSGTTMPVFPRVIFGHGWTLKCEGAASFLMQDDFNWSGGKIVSSDIFTIDKTKPRADNGKSAMLITNIDSTDTNNPITHPITKGRADLTFEYEVPSDVTKRGEGFVRIGGSTPCDLTMNTVMKGAILPFWVSSIGGSLSGKMTFINYETGVLARSGADLDIVLVGRNTKAQSDNYRPTGNALDVNGKDLILVEDSGTASPSTNIKLHSRYAIERGGYLQNLSNGKIVAYSYGADAGKSTHGCKSLDITATSYFPPDTGVASRYAWQVYGGDTEFSEDITLRPTCMNYKGTVGNEETFSIMGKARRITVVNPVGYDTGYGLWLLLATGLNGIFQPQLSDIKVIGGRWDSSTGAAYGNGCISVFTGTPAAGATAHNITLQGLSSPAGTGTSYVLRHITGDAKILDCEIDGVTDKSTYDSKVYTVSCDNPSIVSWVTDQKYKEFAHEYAESVKKADLATNSTKNTVVATLDSIGSCEVRIALRARHDGQPSGNFIDKQFKLFIGSSDTIGVSETGNAAAGQTLSFSYNSSTGEITMNHTSTSALGFSSTNFWSTIESTVPLTVR